jgi:hypothetical protein
VLLQTTIPTISDDWSIDRFSRLAALLRQQRQSNGDPMFTVTSRDREALTLPDSVLSRLDTSAFDEMWLFAVDSGDGLCEVERAAIDRFREKGRGVLISRDHMDLGCSICRLEGIGKAHYFHTHNRDPDQTRHTIDDRVTRHILWPNFRSGANGDFQELTVVGPTHPVLADAASPTGAIRFLPAHPHEGGVGAPEDEPARIIATGISKASGAIFNLAVAFEASRHSGRALAQSSFHHFADYNWDPRLGCPSFVDEPAGTGMQHQPQALEDAHRYAVNAAQWLASAV